MNEPRRKEIEDKQRFVSDVFHTLSQPLTALHCSLELAVRRPMTPAEYRAAIQSALESTERLMQATSFVRQLAEAEDPGETSAIDFSAILKETVAEFTPVAESQEIRVESLVPCSLPVLADPLRLQKCLFFLLDFALQSCISASALRIEAVVIQDRAVATIAVATDESCTIAGSRGFELSTRILAAIGGSLACIPSHSGLEIRIELPLRREAIGTVEPIL